MDSGELFQSLNSKGRNLQTNVQIITLDDNLSHPYFTSVNMAKDNLRPMGSVVVETMYTPYISDYWIKYRGIVVVSFDIKEMHYTNTNAKSYLEEHELKQRINNTEYNYSFVGRVGKFKQKGNKFIIHFQDVGWKFLQKVPKEFRDTYIANQPLDQAFQAICEFLGVQFAYSIEDLHEFNFGADGYSVTKDNQVIEDVKTILSEWGQAPEEEEENEEEDELADPKLENDGLIEIDKKNKDNKDYVKKENNDEKIEENKDDMQATIDKYQEEFDEKIRDLFIGNSYYESDVASNVMNYDQITVTPVAPANDTTTTNSNMDTTEEGNQQTDGTGTADQNSSDQNQTNTPS